MLRSSRIYFFLCGAYFSNIEDAPTEKAPGCLVSCFQAWPVKNYFRPVRRQVKNLNQEAKGSCAKPQLKTAPLNKSIQTAGYCAKPKLKPAPLLFPIQTGGYCTGYC